jgi:drug/metabolite transporter (DMT)-like permease
VALSGPASSVGLGLVAATTWGGSDFAGGIGARRASALLVAASGHVITLIVLLSVCGFGHLPFPHSIEFVYGAVGGLEGSLALAIFYRALAMGAMGLTAALTGLLTALVPVLFGLWSEGLPRPIAIGGLLMGCVAIWMIAHSPAKDRTGHATPRIALLLGALSGVGFGLQLVLLKLAANGGVLWALTSARIGGVAALLLVLLVTFLRGAQPGYWTGFWKMGILAGVLDTIGNIGYTVAAHNGRLDVAAMVSSLYPGATIVLAALLLRERPTRRQTLGMAVALGSVVLLSL